ncbi:MAG: F0F1 ATP synthase subunit epsilon [Rhodothermaceae bacterium]|nr:F0F1 ATP synthase subunit epsilon [Rhodothermaceae bacterium]MYF41651.1 F0F1 ATP synthase subunit epsilon [Rhodothermaceae bacterium]MYH07737.1 F0F1 ATP synthase subunit epsilon [Rhodothermaceae bacterium]
MADEVQRALRVDIVAPDKRVFQGFVTGLRAPGADGGFEIRYNHAPMIASLTVGPLVLTTSSTEKLTFATSGGFVEVIGNVVTVLAETAEPATDIDTDRAKNAEQRALKRLEEASADLDRVRAEQALERARNRLRISMAE